MTVIVTFNVNGMPKTKGSMRYVGGRMIEGNHGSKQWRDIVTTAAFDAIGGIGEKLPNGFPVEGVSLHLDATFRFHRPKSRRRGGPITRSTGDLDKLLRNILDALQDAGVIGDDAQFTSCTASKRYVGESTMPGVAIVVTRLPEEL